MFGKRRARVNPTPVSRFLDRRPAFLRNVLRPSPTTGLGELSPRSRNPAIVNSPLLARVTAARGCSPPICLINRRRGSASSTEHDDLKLDVLRARSCESRSPFLSSPLRRIERERERYGLVRDEGLNVGRRFQAYSAMSPNGEPAAPILGSAVTSAASLPPMSTFRGSGAVGANTGTGAPSPASLQYSHSPGAPTSAPSAPNPAPTTNQPPATGDNLGKTLASVVSTRVSTLIHRG